MGTIKVIKIDLHGYHPSEIVQTDVLKKIIQQTWEMGENYVTLIHGHGRNRGISRQVLLIQTQGTLGWKFVAACAVTRS
jgi:DNA-nicking Smr family endonuclease